MLRKQISYLTWIDTDLFDVSNYHGYFCAGGPCSGQFYLPPVPGMQIHGSIPVLLPLVPSFVDKIKSDLHAHDPQDAASFGVLSCGLEIDAAAVSITNPRWGPALEGLVKEVLETFGIDRKDASFELVKLSFESAGDTRPPSPTSKTSSSQFGTIEIQFPSIFTGGSRTILHDGWRRSFSMGADDSSCHHECFFAAWYDGCQHSQQSLEQGCRLVATYSLLWKGAGDPPRAPAMLAAEQLANALANTTRRFGFFLCSGSSGFRDLKGRDRQLVGLLMAASAKMEQENPGDVLELHICTAATVDQHYVVSF